jgi:serine/threonine-protein kinase
MSITIGTQLGSHTVTALLGRGGMGAVYRARDAKLKREVAIKILPEEFHRDPERIARFQREAEIVASLNHPNIAAIYDFQESDGARFLVLELIEGETLTERIARGPIPIGEALPIARQIVDGLEAAHEKGIVHRDLKPSNIKITPDGMVKILDFGLAKVRQAEAKADSNSPTLLSAAVQGVLMGTAAYMSPEQAVGKEVDKRADIWAFGIVLWEMLTGERLFGGGETISHVLADVLRAPIDFEKLPRETPASIRALVKRCLDRNVRTRLRDMGEARVALTAPVLTDPAAAVTSGTSAVTGQAGPKARLRGGAPVVAGVFAITAVALGFLLYRATRQVEHSLIRLDVDLGPDVSLPLPDFNGSNVILSPDGARLVYTASVGGGPAKLYIRKLDQAKATELPGTEGATGPFFSSDGQWIGFSSGGLPGNQINKVSIEGGAVVTVTNTAGGAAAWDRDGSVIVGVPGRGLMRISPDGGQPALLAPLASGEFADWFPQILPGGKAVLLEHLVSPGPESQNVEVITLADHKRKTFVHGGTTARYLADSNGSGYLVYTNKSTLFAVPFDPDKLETRGTPVPVLDDVMPDSEGGVGQFAFSPASGGTLVYRKGSGVGAGALTTIQWVDAAGKREPLAAKMGQYLNPRISPDGKRIAVQIQGQTPDIWVYEWQRDAWTKLTFGGAVYISPAWTPDGRYVVFGSIGQGMFWTRSDGAGQPQRLMQSNGLQGPSSFTPNGKRLAYIETGNAGNAQIWTVPIEDNDGQLKAGKPEPFLQDKFTDVVPIFSPDGHWLAYMSDESGRNDVYVRAFPPPTSGQGGKWLVSNAGGGVNPFWSHNGHELLYQSLADQIMAVSYTVNGDSFVPDKSRVWLPKLGEVSLPYAMWDLSPDGKRLAVVTPASAPEAASTKTGAEHVVVLLQNFMDELRRRVPQK